MQDHRSSATVFVSIYFRSLTSDRRGTLKTSGSTVPDDVSLQKRAISHLVELHERFGRCVIPFCCVVPLKSAMKCSALQSFASSSERRYKE